MAGTVEQRLRDMGVELPAPAAPAANYIPYVVTGNLVYVSGQVTISGGEVCYIGKIGDNLSVEDGYQAARLCAINLLAQVREACYGDLDRVLQVVKLGGFVNSTPDFTNHPEVINGASDLIAEAFGDAGKHARFAVGAGSLPRGVAVEVDGIFEIS